MSIGENIKFVRNQRGLSTNDLAKLTNLSNTTIKEYESCKKVPTINNLSLIANVLNTDMNTLCQESENLSMENLFSVEDFRVIRNLLGEMANYDGIFDTVTTLYDKADLALKSMEYKQRLHKFDYEPIRRNTERGYFLLTRREKLHISRSDLAEACGVTSNVVCKWESGVTKPARKHLNVLKEWLSLTEDEIEHFIYTDSKRAKIIDTVEKLTEKEIVELDKFIKKLRRKK